MLDNLRRLGAYAAGVVEAAGGSEAASALVQPEDTRLLAALTRALAVLRAGDASDEALDAAAGVGGMHACT